MDKPQVDSIRGIPPAIAIEQQNAVKTTRSTVGTITEINDYLKLLFSADSARATTRLQETSSNRIHRSRFCERRRNVLEKDGALLILFGITVPAKTKPAEFFEFLQQQGYLRVWIFGEAYRVDAPEKYKTKTSPQARST
jgi:excinuclease ABC subunit A